MSGHNWHAGKSNRSPMSSGHPHVGQQEEVHVYKYVYMYMYISKAHISTLKLVEEVIGWLGLVDPQQPTNLLQDPNRDAFAHAAHASQLGSCNIYMYIHAPVHVHEHVYNKDKSLPIQPQPAMHGSNIVITFLILLIVFLSTIVDVIVHVHVHP